MRSYRGAMTVEGVDVELLGDIQRRREDGAWGAPADVDALRVFVTFAGRQIPVLPLEYEITAYQQMGRTEKAEAIRRFLEGSS
jgi:hypothetical protein